MYAEITFPLHAQRGAAYLTAPNIPARHAFSTRLGGVSTGVLESLNLSVRRGDTPENVRENWRRLGAAAGLDLTRAVYAKQVHSADVRIAHAADAQPPEHEPRFTCDGFVTNEPGVALTVFMADCLPALLHDPAAGVIGAVHCGWRGSVADVLGAAVTQMCALGAHPADIRAAIGPGIGACCFEVGPEVVTAAEALLGAPLGALVRPTVGAARSQACQCPAPDAARRPGGADRRVGRLHHVPAGCVLVAPCDRRPPRRAGRRHHPVTQGGNP